MPRYFFNVQNGGELIQDPDGVELPSLELVREECAKVIREVLEEQEWPHQRGSDSEFRIVVSWSNRPIVPFNDPESVRGACARTFFPLKVWFAPAADQLSHGRAATIFGV
jgi:hypothetical protein